MGQHDLIAALAVDLVRDDVQIEELDLFVRELVLVAQRWGLAAVDGRHLALETDDEGRYRHDRVLAHGHRITPALQAPGGGRHVVGILHPVGRGAARLGKADQQVGVANAADFLLVHVLQKEILRLLVLVRHARIDVAQVVGKGTDIVEVVLGPAREMRPRELAGGPGDREGREIGALALDGVLERGAELDVIHKLGHWRLRV